jgi:chaperonin GroEL (HSP60 family)
LLESAFEKINLNDNKYFGYDIVTDKYYDNMINEGIIDSFNTMKTSLEDSVSIASLIITTECIVYKEENYERIN